jgi:protein gp37
MAPLKPNGDGWWDATWNTMAGCRPLSPGCALCYAARDAGTLQGDLDVPLYRGTTLFKAGRHWFNDTLRELPPEHPEWIAPLLWKGAAKPLLGEGRPSLIFVLSMAELFLPERPKAVIDRTLGTLVSSRHLGLVLTKRPEEMVAYLAGRPQRWREKLWVGFSAEDQAHFDERWKAMRTLAEQGWTVFVSVAPMLGPVRLPDDFLTLGRWVICAGEQGPHRDCRPMDLLWARALRDQCEGARLPFLMKQMAMKQPIPPDLRIRQFPAV